jgi:hypothetical protein
MFEMWSGLTNRRKGFVSLGLLMSIIYTGAYLAGGIDALLAISFIAGIIVSLAMAIIYFMES